MKKGVNILSRAFYEICCLCAAALSMIITHLGLPWLAYYGLTLALTSRRNFLNDLAFVDFALINTGSVSASPIAPKIVVR